MQPMPRVDFHGSGSPRFSFTTWASLQLGTSRFYEMDVVATQGNIDLMLTLQDAKSSD